MGSSTHVKITGQSSYPSEWIGVHSPKRNDSWVSHQVLVIISDIAGTYVIFSSMMFDIFPRYHQCLDAAWNHPRYVVFLFYPGFPGCCVYFGISHPILFLVKPPVPQLVLQSMTTSMSISKLMRRSVRRPGDETRNWGQEPIEISRDFSRQNQPGIRVPSWVEKGDSCAPWFAEISLGSFTRVGKCSEFNDV